MIKWPYRCYTHFMHYPFREHFDHTAEKNVTSHSDLRETLVCFSFWYCCCCCLVCAHYIEQFERNTLNGEKKMWMKVHTLRQFIDSESDKTERRAFYFHSKTKCTYHFNICFAGPYFGGIQHFVLHKKNLSKKVPFWLEPCEMYAWLWYQPNDIYEKYFLKKNYLIWNKVAIFWFIRLIVVVVYCSVCSPNKFSRRHYRSDNFFVFRS